MTVCRRGYVGMTALVALGLAASPLAAQNATVPDPPPPSANGVVGPRELQDFNLPGAVIRPAEPAVSAPPRTVPSTATLPAERPARTTADLVRSPTATSPASSSPASSSPASSSPNRPSPASGRVLAPTIAPPPSVGGVLPPADPSSPGNSPSEIVASPLAIDPASSSTAPMWPWLLALLAAAGAAGFFFLRRQRGEAGLAFAGDGLSETLPAAPPQPRAPTPLPRAPVASTSALPPPPIPGGIVATALKPELELIFTPLSVAVDDAGTAMVVFDLVVHNHGSAPARDVLVEAGMFNAGPNQDRLIGDFFASPRAEGDRIPVIAPMGKVGVRSRVSIPAERIGELEMAGRKLLVPLVAFNTMFRWAGGETQRSASFLVGRGSNEEPKLKPFALDRGSRAWGDVAARSHSMGLAI